MGIKVWAVTQGPTAIEDLPEDELSPEDSGYFLVCKTEIDGEIEEANFWFDDFEDAYEWKKHFDRSIEPLEVGEMYKEHMT